MRRFINELIAGEISRATRYGACVVQVEPLGFDDGLLLGKLDAPARESVSLDEFRAHSRARPSPVHVLLNGNLNHHCDVQALLQTLHEGLGRTSRVVAVLFSPYWAYVYRVATALGIRKGDIPTTFLTESDLRSVAKLADFEVVRLRHVGFIPFRMLGLGTWINRFLAACPGLRWLSMTNVVVLRPITHARERPSLSIIIPARDEAGNIENALKQLPRLGVSLEVIFVEGHSSDGTWDEIQRVQALYGDRFTIKSLQQEGVGKSDAVRVGLSHASSELLTILDADLTMPPEKLSCFYEAYVAEKADFINGSRLLYPMEGEAMRLLNKVGNLVFARLLSWVLDHDLTDSLCGTKLFRRDDYERMTAWRRDFGDFDPFGDFELLFPAASLGIGCIDMPIRYRDRTYGSTSISRFRHGIMLFRMAWIGFAKIKLGARREH